MSARPGWLFISLLFDSNLLTHRIGSYLSQRSLSHISKTKNVDWERVRNIVWISWDQFMVEFIPGKLNYLGSVYIKRSLMSWVVVIPKEGRASIAAFILLLVWPPFWKKKEGWGLTSTPPPIFNLTHTIRIYRIVCIFCVIYNCSHITEFNVKVIIKSLSYFFNTPYQEFSKKKYNLTL